MPSAITYLLDVDNTLLDNDQVISDLHRQLDTEIGPEGAVRYWQIFEALRLELGYADYLGALQAWRREADAGVINKGENDKGANDKGLSIDGSGEPPDPRRVMRVSAFLLDYPFTERLYPRALEVLAHLERYGRTVILSDGDAVFQTHKVRRSGLWQAVDGNVLIYIHKQQKLAEVQRLYPARHYVMVDDKLQILADMKTLWPRTLTTIFPRQGHYALDAAIVAAHSSAADLTIEHIGELADADLSALG